MSSGFMSTMGTSWKSMVPLIRFSRILASEGWARPLLPSPDMLPRARRLPSEEI